MLVEMGLDGIFGEIWGILQQTHREMWKRHGESGSDNDLEMVGTLHIYVSGG